MSNAYITWAWKVPNLKPSDRLVLFRIADLVDDQGCWQIVIGDLARAVGISHSTARRALDRIALDGLVVFKAEAYRQSKAQAAHRFRLVRTAGERTEALAQGFVSDRRVLDREGNCDKVSPQNWKEGGFTGGRRVGSLLDPHITPQNTSPLAPEPSEGGGGATASAREEPTTAEDASAALWRSFAAAYPRHPADLDGPAERAFGRLSSADQREAVRWLPEYLRRWAAEKASGLKRHLPHRRTWIEDRGWLTVVRPAATPPPQPASTVAGSDRHGILAAIAAALGEDVFGSWFAECRVVDVDAASVTLAWSKPFTRKWVSDHFSQRVIDAVRTVEPGCQRVAMVDGPPAGPQVAKLGAIAVVPPLPHQGEEGKLGTATRHADVFKDAHHLKAEVLALAEERGRR